MRVAVAGKGGAGKTTIAATLARVTARAGRDVLCLDADSNPNLAVALGVDDDLSHSVLPTSIVSRRLDGPALATPLDEVLATHSVPGPDGIRLSHMGMPGHAEAGCLCSAHGAVRAVLGDLAGRGVVTFLDLEASPEHFSRGTARHVDWLLLVAEPYFRSLMTIGRMATLAGELGIPRIGVVGNKLRDSGDEAAVREFARRHDLSLLAEIPWDDAVLDADRDRRPLAEAAPDGPAAGALARLATRLLEEARPATEGSSGRSAGPESPIGTGADTRR